MDYAYVDVDEIEAETDKAFLFMIGKNKVWVPKSQMADPEDYSGGDVNLEDVAVAQWLADEKGIGK